MKPLLVLITGDPVPDAERRRGSFFQMLQTTAAGSWPGPWQAHRLDSLGTDSWESLPEPDELSACIVTGSPAMLSERAEWMLQGEAYLRRLLDEQRCVLGICFGHQMLAQALGVQVGPNPRGREIGTVALTPTTAPTQDTEADDGSALASTPDDPLWGRLERMQPAAPRQVNMSHVESVLQLPPAARVLGTTARDPHAAVRFGARAWGVQFHPEFDRGIMRDYVQTRADTLRQEGFVPEDLHASTTDALWGSRVVSAFAQLVEQLATDGLDGG